MRFRKRAAVVSLDRAATSGVLRSLRDLVAKGQHAQALSQIDALVGVVGLALDYKVRLLSIAADGLHMQGKFAEAASAFAAIGQLAQGNPLTSFRPALGEVRSLLKNVQVAEAQNRTLAAMQRATANWQQYQTQLVQAQAIVAAGGQAVIPAQPPTPDSVAYRLGKLFFSEGEVAPAKALFQQALQLYPASPVARIALAEVALRENSGADAARLAREAITVGMFTAKTLAAWPVLLAAGRRLGTDTLDTTLLNSLAQATPAVRSHIVLILARELRGQGDARWSQIANNWLQNSATGNPVITAELRKLKATHARVLNATATNQQQTAQAVLQTAKIGPDEMLCAAKQVVRTTLLQNQTPDIPTLLTQAATKYGTGKRTRFAHGLGLACKAAGRADLALPLFQQNIATATGAVLGKSLWAVAKVQSSQGDHVGAAQNFLSYSQNSAFPKRFRLYALLQWTQEVAAANQPELIAQARPQIEAALPLISDYELVLDMARQVYLSKLPREFALQVFQRGQQLALQAFDSCEHPSAAVTILFKLCRRANDQWLHDAMIATWTRLTEQKRLWLWSECEDYWHWIELVFRGYRDARRFQDAEQFAVAVLNDPATPPHGYGIFAVSYAAMKRTEGDFAAMFSVYEQMTRIAPGYEWTSAAYYWLALRAWKEGNAPQTTRLAEKMLVVIGKDWKMVWKARMVAKALCLKAGLDLNLIAPQVEITRTLLESQQAEIGSDLARLPV